MGADGTLKDTNSLVGQNGLVVNMFVMPLYFNLNFNPSKVYKVIIIVQ